jgi:hypothetical protein
MTQCWERIPENRPTIMEILRNLIDDSKAIKTKYPYFERDSVPSPIVFLSLDDLEMMTQDTQSLCDIN